MLHSIATHPFTSTAIALAAVCLIVLIAQVVLISSGNDQEKMQQPWS